MKEFFTVAATGILILFLLYLASRLISAGYYRSKKNFIEWYKQHKEERKGNVTREI